MAVATTPVPPRPSPGSPAAVRTRPYGSGSGSTGRAIPVTSFRGYAVAAPTWSGRRPVRSVSVVAASTISASASSGSATPPCGRPSITTPATVSAAHGAAPQVATVTAFAAGAAAIFSRRAPARLSFVAVSVPIRSTCRAAPGGQAGASFFT